MGSNKSKNGIFFEATEAQKRKIKKNAALCGMRQGEYILRRALGYEPKAVQPDAFYHFHRDLCVFLNKELTPEMEAAALRLFDEIYAELIDDRKQPSDEIREEITGAPQSLLCGEKEHPDPFAACGKREERRCDATWQPPDYGPSSAD